MNVTPDRAGFQPLSRRVLLMAAPALPVAKPMEAATLLAETPALQLFREIQALKAVMNDRATSQEEFDRLYEDVTALEWRLTREPATCAADVAAKVLHLTSIKDDYGSIFEPELRVELETLVGRIAQ